MSCMQENHWQLPLAAWSEWPGADGDELPKLDFVEPMVRRRLSALSKISLWVAHQCAHDLPDVRMIYASQHGEIVRTTAMLEELTAGEPLSPTAFSMSVLNASIGLYSILCGNTAPSTAIAAGAETLGYALLEAHGQLHNDPTRPVLVIYADETVPSVWEAATHAPHAIALLLHGDATRQLHCMRGSGGAVTSPPQTQAQALVECLKNGSTSNWDDGRHQWQWQCVAA